jgi:hypothetical protein
MALHRRSRAVWTRDWVLFLFFLGVLALLCIGLAYAAADILGKIADYLVEDQ